MLFSFGFLAPFAIGFFITLNPKDIFLTSIVAGLGASLSCWIMFHTIRISFMKEFNRLENTKTIKKIIKLIDKKINHKVRNYLLYIFAGIVISSPLPDEIGITMLAGLTKIKQNVLIIISFILSTIGIWIILILSR
jgi:membrane protein DedA with SNARE-associated domain